MDADPGFSDHLAALALAVKEHAVALAGHDSDREGIGRVYDRSFANDGASAA